VRLYKVFGKHLGIVILALTAAACAAPRPRPKPVPSPGPSAGLQALPAAGTYRIDPAQSELRVLVYRGGALANLGHNHVMVDRNVSGSIVVGASLSASSFFASVAVNGFEVDDAQARREEGADFPGEIPAEAKSGTLHNMLSPAVLDAAQFPQVTVKSVSLQEVQGAPVATLNIRVAGHDSTVDAPFTLQGDPHHLIASGAFELRQSAIGLTPYSLMGGALSVRDAMQLKFKIVAAIDAP
jgi:polyisoprenoid-binding protein YceI